MWLNIRIRFGTFLINRGIACLPESYQSETFLTNMMRTNKIKVEK
jgi:hypothetical protein